MEWATAEQKAEQFRLVLDKYSAPFGDLLDDAAAMGKKPVLKALMYSNKETHRPFIVATEGGDDKRGYTFFHSAIRRMEIEQDGPDIRFAFPEDGSSSGMFEYNGRYLDGLGVFVGTWRRTPQNGHENRGIFVAELAD